MAKQRIARLASAVDGALGVWLEDGAELPFTTTSRVIQMALVTAFAAAAEVQLETYGGDSRVIRRIEAFDVPPASPVLTGKVSRLATQRSADLGVHILEVFVLVEPKKEVQYRVVDETLQRVCHAAALTGARLTFESDAAKEMTVAAIAREPQ